MAKPSKKSPVTSNTLCDDVVRIIESLPTGQSLKDIFILLIDERKASSASTYFSSSPSP
jgi:hypothetical protein